MIRFDIDIDIKDRNEILSKIKYVSATMTVKEEVKQHNVGVYIQNIPADPLTNLSIYDYEEADELGYFKIDFLNNTIYDGIKNEAELNRLMNIEPNWDALLDKDFCKKIAHIGNWYWLILEKQPASVEELAMFLAIIRPAKKHLQNRTWDDIKKEVWIKDDEKYHFKRSHSISFALSLVVQMNLLQRG